MKFKSIALAGCTFIALGAMAAPASATKAEDRREAKITRELNQQQAQNPGAMPSQQSASASDQQNSDQQMAANDSQSNSANTDPNAKNNSSTLGRAATATGNEIDEAVGVKTAVTNAEMRKAVAASEVEDPAKTLATAEVKTRAGDPVGEVKAVEVNPDGTAKAIKADVGGFLGMGERQVNMDAGSLKYIKDRNILVTDMTKPQIQNLAPVNVDENKNKTDKSTY